MRWLISEHQLESIAPVKITALVNLRKEKHMANRPSYLGTPRWVKVFGIIAIVLVLL
jgi:hypothetical protein